MSESRLPARQNAFDRATLGEVPIALRMAGRPGAATLFLAVDGMIRANFFSDKEMGELGSSLAQAALLRINEARRGV